MIEDNEQQFRGVIPRIQGVLFSSKLFKTCLICMQIAVWRHWIEVGEDIKEQFWAVKKPILVQTCWKLMPYYIVDELARCEIHIYDSYGSMMGNWKHLWQQLQASKRLKSRYRRW